MKTTGIQLFLFLLFFVFTESSAQTIQFSYDEAGNRISTRTIPMIRSDVPQEEKEEEDNLTGLTEVLAQHTIRIYPNPTRGIVKIELENVQDGQKATVFLYDMSGKRIASQENVTFSTELDITTHPDGIYIMKIVIGEHESEWKIIKQ